MEFGTLDCCTFLIAHPIQDTAALIIGGSVDRAGSAAIDTVEIFGCPGTQDTYLLDEYPRFAFLSYASFAFEITTTHRSPNASLFLQCNVKTNT